MDRKKISKDNYHKCSPFRATSHTQPRADMLCRNLRHAHHLEMGLTHIPASRETLFILCHVRIHVDFSSSTIQSFGSLDLHLCSGWSRLVRPMRDLRMQWSEAFDLMCEVALRWATNYVSRWWIVWVVTLIEVLFGMDNGTKEWWNYISSSLVTLLVAMRMLLHVCVCVSLSGKGSPSHACGSGV